MVTHTNTRRRFLGVTGVAGLGMLGNINGVAATEANSTLTEDEGEADIVVTVGPDDELVFDLAQLPLSTGETVTFEWASGGHTLTVTHQPDEADWEGVPEGQDTGHTHTHTFEAEGWYEYVCEPHEDDGMTGTILVCDIERPTDDGGEPAPDDDEPDDTDELVIREHELVVEEGIVEEVFVEGLVENTTADDFDYVEVQVIVFDADGNQIDSYIDNTSDLAAGQTWSFEVFILDDADVIDEYEIEVTGSPF